MIKKRHIVAIVSIAVISFLFGTTLNVTVASDGENPFDTLWGAIHGLQSGMDRLNDTLSSRIEDLEEENALLRTDIETLQGQIDSLNATVLELQDRVDVMEVNAISHTTIRIVFSENYRADYLRLAFIGLSILQCHNYTADTGQTPEILLNYVQYGKRTPMEIFLEVSFLTETVRLDLYKYADHAGANSYTTDIYNQAGELIEHIYFHSDAGGGDTMTVYLNAADFV